MPADAAQGPGMTWLVFALMTVLTWGVYGILLHAGQLQMGDPENGRYKAFLFVGIAYFLTAVLAPLILLVLRGASWSYPAKGMSFSLLAGIAGAAGAFAVLLAFGAKGSPTVVMSIIFAGAPVVNAIVSLILHPPAGHLLMRGPPEVAEHEIELLGDLVAGHLALGERGEDDVLERHGGPFTAYMKQIAYLGATG